VSGELGRFGESWTVGYLTRQGFRIVDRNVRYRHGEIDLIARRGVTTVFVEVKCRRGSRFGSPESSITPARFLRLAGAVATYVQDHDMEDADYRIDVVALEVGANGAVTRHEVFEGVEAPR
jgi:putative endonuclease